MSDNGHILKPDTQATLLLCGVFGRETGELKPLTASQFNRLAQSLLSENLSPGDLLTKRGRDWLESSDREGKPELTSASALLERGAALALAVERWTNHGLWVISRSDAEYPNLLKRRLGIFSPPILYGAGNVGLLSGAGLAIVGSREADEPALRFTRRVAELCAAEELQVISGGAKGVDSEAMFGALEFGGKVVGVLPESLEKESVSRKYREALQHGLLTLVSPYHPGARFSVGSAMGRNRIIYALADAALVAATSLENGGTWAGAQENLKHKWVPLIVRNGDRIQDGNRRLIKEGATALGDAVYERSFSLATWLDEMRGMRAAQKPEPQEAEPPEPEPPVATLPSLADTFWLSHVWPVLESLMANPMTEKQVAEAIGVELKQAKAWIKRGLTEGRVKKRSRPVRYELSKQSKLKCM